MSALGHERTLERGSSDVRFTLRADMLRVGTNNLQAPLRDS
jgi:hypothetical protein